jgi:hypothetical protein
VVSFYYMLFNLTTASSTANHVTSSPYRVYSILCREKLERPLSREGELHQSKGIGIDEVHLSSYYLHSTSRRQFLLQVRSIFPAASPMQNKVRDVWYPALTSCLHPRYRSFPSVLFDCFLYDRQSGAGLWTETTLYE